MNYNPKSKKYIFFLCSILSVSIFLNGCSLSSAKSKEPLQKSSFLLDTIVTITLYDSQNETILNECFDLCKKYENLFSKTIPDSDVAKINSNSGQAVSVSDETIDLISYGISYGDISEGKFDISIGSVSNLWDFKSDNPQVPDNSALQQAITHVDYHKIQIDGNQVTIPTGAALDFGGIAKGYIADKLKEYLLEHNVHSAIINLGGNIVLVGQRMDKNNFTVGIQKPFSDIGESITGIQARDCSIVTSGVYERYFKKDGTLYYHILNPETGYPFETDLYSVTIISKKSVDGDGLSTTCLSLGLEKGMELINNTPDTEAVFITNKNKIYYTDGVVLADGYNK